MDWVFGIFGLLVGLCGFSVAWAERAARRFTEPSPVPELELLEQEQQEGVTVAIIRVKNFMGTVALQTNGGMSFHGFTPREHKDFPFPEVVPMGESRDILVTTENLDAAYAVFLVESAEHSKVTWLPLSDESPLTELLHNQRKWLYECRWVWRQNAATRELPVGPDGAPIARIRRRSTEQLLSDTQVAIGMKPPKQRRPAIRQMLSFGAGLPPVR